MSKHVRKNCGKLQIPYILSSKSGITPSKTDAKWRPSNLIWSTFKKSFANFQLNMSKHVGEKCGKLHIIYILSSQRGITPSKIDAKWRHSNLICSTLKQSRAKFQLNMSKHVGEKCEKRVDGDLDGRRVGRTDGDMDGRTSPYHIVILQIHCGNLICCLDGRRVISFCNFLIMRHQYLTLFPNVRHSFV